jgi:hypothetical protein
MGIVGTGSWGVILGEEVAGMWRRPPPDPAAEAAWAGFLDFAKALDEGSRALLATVPSARRPGAPLEASIAGFLAGLEAARAELPAWDHPALADAQAATAAALDAAERRARDLPAASDGLEFERAGRCGAGAMWPGPGGGRPGRAGSRRRPPGPRR